MENSGNTGNVSNPIDQIESSGSNTSNSGKKLPQYKGFDVVGTMDKMCIRDRLYYVGERSSLEPKEEKNENDKKICRKCKISWQN